MDMLDNLPKVLKVTSGRFGIQSLLISLLLTVCDGDNHISDDKSPTRETFNCCQVLPQINLNENYYHVIIYYYVGQFGMGGHSNSYWTLQ